MSKRDVPLVTGEIYHVYNHAIDDHDVCSTEREYRRMLLTLWFYQPQVIQIKLSQYLTLTDELQQQMINSINQKAKCISIHSFSLMPNHYHLLIEQLSDKGLSTYIGNIQNSYTKYYNAKWERNGSLFLRPFKAKRITTAEQFIHTSRYISLNRYSSGLMKHTNELRTNPTSSIPYFLHTIPIENLSSVPIEYFKYLELLINIGNLLLTRQITNDN